MSKPVKNMIMDELRARYSGIDSALWVELVGADGLTTNEFRRTLRSRHMRVDIVKNALFRRAVSGGPLAKLGDELNGPAAVMTGGESVTHLAKLVEEWQPKIKGLKLRGAVIEGEYLDESRMPGLSKMPTKRDLQGQVVSAALSPGRKLAAAMLSPGSNIASCLKTIIEKLEKGEAIVAV